MAMSRSAPERIFLSSRNDVIYTTPRAGILEGITRDSLITLAGDLGYSVVEEPISRDQLYIADEVFVCGTAAEVIALREIDFRTIGSGKTGPVTRASASRVRQIGGRKACAFGGVVRAGAGGHGSRLAVRF